APEAAPLDPATLTRVLHDRPGEVCFTLHPSLRIILSSFPALSIWRMNIAGGVPGPVDLEAGGEDVLIVRPQADVEVRNAPLGGAELLVALGRGKSLDQAAEAALVVAPSFELAEHLTVLLSAGARCACRAIPALGADKVERLSVAFPGGTVSIRGAVQAAHLRENVRISSA